MHTTPNEIAPRRDPIKKKLPRENNHFRRGPRLPNSRDRLQNHPLGNASSRKSLEEMRVGRLHRIATIGTASPRPPIVPNNPRKPSRNPEEIGKEIQFPDEERSPPRKIPNPDHPFPVA